MLNSIDDWREFWLAVKAAADSWGVWPMCDPEWRPGREGEMQPAFVGPPRSEQLADELAREQDAETRGTSAAEFDGRLLGYEAEREGYLGVCEAIESSIGPALRSSYRLILLQTGSDVRALLGALAKHLGVGSAAHLGRVLQRWEAAQTPCGQTWDAWSAGFVAAWADVVFYGQENEFRKGVALWGFVRGARAYCRDFATYWTGAYVLNERLKPEELPSVPEAYSAFCKWVEYCS